jgi:hypothetical protein
MTDTTAIEQRDEQVAEAITSGKSLRSVKRQFSLTEAELDGILERLWPVSTEARIRMIKHDVGCLQRLIEKFYEKALSGSGDVNSAAVVVKAWERKAALLGLDAVQRIDLQIINPPQTISRHEKIREAILRLTNPERFQQPNNGDGAAVSSDAVLPADDPAEPK